MYIIGVDPGSRKTGFAILEKKLNQPIRCVEAGTLYLDKYPKEQRLGHLFQEVQRWGTAYPLSVLAIERIFLHKNTQSVFTLSQARGIIIGAMQMRGLDMVEYAPRRIKMGVTGTGAATKQQVQKMVQSILGLNYCPQEDCADAMAAALCYLFTKDLGIAKTQGQRRQRRWKEYDLTSLRISS
jgi:crossover junction endodeoxyribonuclease RuvC